MANFKIEKGNITINKKPNAKAESLGTLFHVGGITFIGLNILVSCSETSSLIGFNLGALLSGIALGLFVFFIGDVIKLMAYSCSPQYQYVIEELEGTINNMDVTVKNSVKINGIVEADLKKISIPKPTSPKPTPKSATDSESKA